MKKKTKATSGVWTWEKKKAKRKNPADLTTRNLKAQKKREAGLKKRIEELERVVNVLEHDVLFLLKHAFLSASRRRD